MLKVLRRPEQRHEERAKMLICSALRTLRGASSMCVPENVVHSKHAESLASSDETERKRPAG